MEIRDATILITGGAGLVGSHIVEALLPLGPRRVVLVDNLVRGSLRNLAGLLDHRAVTFIRGDICDRPLLDRCMAEADGCFHTAALRINHYAEAPDEGHAVMVDAMYHLVESAQRHGVEKIVYSSSASIYGLAQRFPTPETDHPYDNRTLYGVAKLFGEQLLRSWHAMFGLPYVSLRYFNIYGPRMDREGRYTEVMVKWLDCLRDGRQPTIFGDGSTSMDFVYVEDVARANVAALASDVSDEALNIGSGRETTLSELLELLLTIDGTATRPRYEPASRVNPVRRRVADIRRAQELLGFEPRVTLEAGLRRLREWYLEQPRPEPPEPG